MADPSSADILLSFAIDGISQSIEEMGQLTRAGQQFGQGLTGLVQPFTALQRGASGVADAMQRAAINAEELTRRTTLNTPAVERQQQQIRTIAGTLDKIRQNPLQLFTPQQAQALTNLEQQFLRIVNLQGQSRPGSIIPREEMARLTTQMDVFLRQLGSVNTQFRQLRDIDSVITSLGKLQNISRVGGLTDSSGLTAFLTQLRQYRETVASIGATGTESFARQRAGWDDIITRAKTLDANVNQLAQAEREFSAATTKRVSEQQTAGVNAERQISNEIRLRRELVALQKQLPRTGSPSAFSGDISDIRGRITSTDFGDPVAVAKVRKEVDSLKLSMDESSAAFGRVQISRDQAAKAEAAYAETVRKRNAESQKAAVDFEKNISAQTRFQEELVKLQERSSKLRDPSSVSGRINTLQGSVAQANFGDPVKVAQLRKEMDLLSLTMAQSEKALPKIADGMEKFFGRFGRYIQVAGLLTITYAGLNAVFAGFRDVLEIDKQLSILAGTLDDNVDRAKVLTQGYEQMFEVMRSTGKSTKEAGEFVVALSKSIDDAGERQAAFRGALALTAQGEVNQEEAVNVLVAAYKTFGHTLGDNLTAQEKFSILSGEIIKAANISTGSVKSLAEAVKTSGAIAGTAGVEFHQLLGFLTIMQDAFRRNSLGGTQLARALHDVESNARNIAYELGFINKIDFSKPIDAYTILTKTVEIFSDELQRSGGLTEKSQQVLTETFKDQRARQAILTLAQTLAGAPGSLQDRIQTISKEINNFGAAGTKVLEEKAKELNVQLGNLGTNFLDVTEKFLQGVAGIDSVPGKFEATANALAKLNKYLETTAENAKIVGTFIGDKYRAELQFWQDVFGAIGKAYDAAVKYFDLSGNVKRAEHRGGGASASFDDSPTGSPSASTFRPGSPTYELPGPSIPTNVTTLPINQAFIAEDRLKRLASLQSKLNDELERMDHDKEVISRYSAAVREAERSQSEFNEAVKKFRGGSNLQKQGEDATKEALAEIERLGNKVNQDIAKRSQLEKDVTKSIDEQEKPLLKIAELYSDINSDLVKQAAGGAGGLSPRTGSLTIRTQLAEYASQGEAFQKQILDKFIDRATKAERILIDALGDPAAYESFLGTLRQALALEEAVFNSKRIEDFQNQFLSTGEKILQEFSIIAGKAEVAFSTKPNASLANQAEDIKQQIKLLEDEIGTVEELETKRQAFYLAEKARQQTINAETSKRIAFTEERRGTQVTDKEREAIARSVAEAITGQADALKEVTDQESRLRALYAQLALIADVLKVKTTGGLNETLTKIAEQKIGLDKLNEELLLAQATMGLVGGAAAEAAAAAKIGFTSLGEVFAQVTALESIGTAEARKAAEELLRFAVAIGKVKATVDQTNLEKFRDTVATLNTQFKSGTESFNQYGVALQAQAIALSVFHKALSDTTEAERSEIETAAKLAESIKNLTTARGLAAIGFSPENAVKTANQHSEVEQRLADRDAGIKAINDLNTAQERFFQQELARIQEMARASGDIGTFFAKSFEKAATAGTDLFSNLETLARSTASNMQTGFSDLFFNVFTGNLKSAGDVFKSFLNSMVRALSDFLGSSIVRLFGSFLSGGGGGGTSGGGATGAALGIVSRNGSFGGGLSETGSGTAGGSGTGGPTTFNVQNFNVPGLGTLTSQSFWQGVMNIPSNWNAGEGLFGGLGNTLFGQAGGFSAIATLPQNFAEISAALGGELAPALNSLVPAVEGTQGLLGAGGGLASSISSFSVALAAVTVALNVYSGIMDVINGDTVKGGATLGGAAAGAGVGALIGLSQAGWTFGSSVVIGAIIGAALGSSAGNLLGGLFGPGPPLSHEQREAIDAGKLSTELKPLLDPLTQTALSMEQLVDLLIKFGSGSTGGSQSVAVVSQLRTPGGLAIIGDPNRTDPNVAKQYPGGVINDPQRIKDIITADPTALNVLVQRGLSFDKFLAPLNAAIAALVNAQISKADTIVKITEALDTDIPAALARILPPEAVEAFIHKLLDPIRAGFESIKNLGPQAFLDGFGPMKKALEDMGAIATFVGGALKGMNKVLDNLQGDLATDLFTALKTKSIDPFKQALIDIATSGRSLAELQPIFDDASRQIQVLGGLATLFTNIGTEIAALTGDTAFLAKQSAKDIVDVISDMSTSITELGADLGIVIPNTGRNKLDVNAHIADVPIADTPKYGETKDRDPQVELLLLSQLHDAIIARYQLEQKAIQSIEESLAQLISGVGQSLTGSRIQFAAFEKESTGSAHGFTLINRELKNLAQNSPSLVVKLYAIAQGISAIIANVGTLRPGEAQGLADVFSAAGPDGLTGAANPFGNIFDNILEKSKPFIEVFEKSIKAALDVGDDASALGLLEKEKQTILGMAKGAVDAITEWANATIAVYEKQIEGLEKEKQVIQDRIDAIELEKRGIQDQIDAYSHQQTLLQRQVDAYSFQQTLLQRQITAYDRQEKGLQKQLTAYDKQEKVLQKQLSGYDRDEKVLQKQLTGYDKAEKLLQKQLDGIDKEEKVLQKQIAGYEKEERVLQKSLAAYEKQEKVLQKQITQYDRDERAPKQQIADYDRQEKVLQKQIAGYDREEKVLQRQIAGYDREEKVLQKQLAAYDKDEKVLQKQLTAFDREEKGLNKQLEGYRKQEAALNKQSEALSKQETSLNKQLSALNEQIQLVEQLEAAITSISDLIHSSLIGSGSPLSPTARATQADIAFKRALSTAEKDPTAENAKLLEKAFSDRLTTAQAVLSRNSPEYQKLFFESIGGLRDVQGKLKKQEPGDLGELKKEKSDVEKQIDAIELQKEAIQAQVDAIQALEEPIQAQLDAIEELKAGVQEQIDAIETLKEPIQEQIDAIGELKDGIQEQIDAIGLLKEPIQDQIDALELLKEPLQDQIDGIELLKQGVQDQIDAIELLKEPIQDQIDAIEELKAGVQEQIDALELLKEPIQDQIDAIELLKEGVQDQIDAIELLKEGVQEQIDAIELLKEPIQDQIDAIEDLKGDIQDQIDAIELLKEPIQDQIHAIDLLKQPLEDAIHGLELTQRALRDDITAIDLIERGIRADIELVRQSATEAINAITARLPALIQPILDKQKEIFDKLIKDGNDALSIIIGDSTDAESYLGKRAKETVDALNLIKADIAKFFTEGIVLKVNPNAAGTPSTFNDGSVNISGSAAISITAPVTITAASISVNGTNVAAGPVDTHPFGGGGGGGQGGQTFATGTPFVPRDMLAQIHKGEAVLTVAQNQLWQQILDKLGTDPAKIVPLAATGGNVAQTGLAVVHEGERIIPRQQIIRAQDLYALYSPQMGPDGRMYLGGWRDSRDPDRFTHALESGTDPNKIVGPDKIYASTFASNAWQTPVLAFAKLGFSVNDPTFVDPGAGRNPTMLYTQFPNAAQNPFSLDDIYQHSIGRARLINGTWTDQGTNQGQGGGNIRSGVWLPSVAVGPDGLRYAYFTSATNGLNYRQQIGGAGRPVGAPEVMQFPQSARDYVNIDVAGGAWGWAMLGQSLDQRGIDVLRSNNGVTWGPPSTLVQLDPSDPQVLTPSFTALTEDKFKMLFGFGLNNIVEAGPFQWDSIPSARSGAWNTREGLYQLHDNETVLNADQAAAYRSDALLGAQQNLFWQRLMAGAGNLGGLMGRSDVSSSGDTKIELNIAPGAFQISSPDPESAARMAYSMVEKGIETGTLGHKIRARVKGVK